MLPVLISLVISILCIKYIQFSNHANYIFTVIIGLVLYKTVIVSGYIFFKLDIYLNTNKIINSMNVEDKEIIDNKDEFVAIYESVFLEKATGNTGLLGYFILRTGELSKENILNGEINKFFPTLRGIMDEFFCFFSMIFYPFIIMVLFIKRKTKNQKISKEYNLPLAITANENIINPLNYYTEKIKQKVESYEKKLKRKLLLLSFFSLLVV